MGGRAPDIVAIAEAVGDAADTVADFASSSGASPMTAIAFVATLDATST